MMTAQEFSSKAAEVLTKLESPEDVGGLLESLVSDFTARDAEAEKLKADYDEALAKIDRLQRANMELFLRTGVKGAADADTVPDDDEGGSAEKLSPDFSAAMDDKGNIL